MHLVSQLRRALAMMTVLISLLAGLGIASAQADAPILTGGGGRQTPRVADGTPGISSSNATSTPLPTPSPIQTTTPLSSATPSPGTPSSTTGTPGSADSAPAQSTEKTDDQATHVVRFDPDDGRKPTQSTVQTGTLAAPPEKNPVRDGFRFDGWAYNGQPFDFQTPILQGTTLKAKWTQVTDWTLSPDHGPATGARLTISPPSLQEPYYISIHTFGERFVGLTGDGRIYTWTQDSTPRQVPFPAEAPDGFRYLQAAAGSRWQAALGSDQKIYTWTSGQSTPTILDTNQSTKFTSINMNGERLLAVDRQGQVHALQASQNTKPAEQAKLSLPAKTQPVIAVASGSRILALDSDGQAWTWDASNTGNIKPTRIRQDPGMRFTQAQSLSQGFLLLDADGQARYLADNTTSIATVSLPEGMKASQLTANKDQAIITGTDGRVWAWKPGEVPKRADNGNQRYMQAASTGSRITAVDRQGSTFTWHLDRQGRPDKPARLDTATAPILESASMDGQALTLSRNNGSWQTDIPARKPGPAAILIAGRQDDQPFTRSLNYTVDQPLTRDDQQGMTHTVTFNADGGSPRPADQNISDPYGRVKRPSPDPTRKGFLFDGWFIGQVAYDFSRPVDKDLTLTAKWTPESRKTKWSISPNKGSQLGRKSTTIIPPENTSRGIRFSQVCGGKDFNSRFSLAVGSDGNAYAWGYNHFGQLGDGTTASQTTPVKVEKLADAPVDFTYVQVSAGGDHSLALGSDGNAYAWGYNGNGQLGNNETTDSSVPVLVRDPASPADKSKGLKATQVSAGYQHSLALGSDGKAYAWGWNLQGELGNNMGGYGAYATVPAYVRDPASPADKSKGLKATQVSAGYAHSLALGSDGYAWAWGLNSNGQLGTNSYSNSTVPVPVVFNPTPVITGVRFDQTPALSMTNGDSNSATVLTPEHLPATVTVSVDYTLGGAPQQPDTSLRYTYLSAGVLPRAGGEGILLALATGMTAMGGVLASRRHREETHQLLHASHE